MESYLDPQAVQEVYRAYLFGAEAHEGQIRLTGEPYIYHPIQVARTLAELRLDAPTLCAAILHDVIEDTGIGKDRIATLFGAQVAELVDGVSKLTSLENDNPVETQAASFQKMIMAMCRDIRVILVKLADRLHNARTWHVKKSRSRHRIARETLEIYAPIAMRLGMYQLAQQLEDLSFMALYPWRYQVLRARIDQFCGHRQRLESWRAFEHGLAQRLEQAEIQGRVELEQKTPYYVYRKMRLGKSFHQIIAPFRFHVVVAETEDCYRMLGQIHSLYKPRPGGFKDYIAIPKANGYQSLHTKLIAAKGQSVEVHIRTQRMNRVAALGIAGYGMIDPDKSSPTLARAREWVQRLLELQRNTSSSVEFLDNVKIDLFPDDVYVFTPQGTITELPRGATVIDFAYAVHSDLGHQAINARLDGRYAPLNTVLQNGQAVEIITASWAKPHLEWLDFAMTAKARSSIRNHFKTLGEAEAISLGRRILERELSRRGLALEEISDAQWEAVTQVFHYDSLAGLFRAIGLGSRLAFQVVKPLLRESLEEPIHSPATTQPVIIQGTEGLLVTLAKCCRPIPGDHVIGHVTAGRGLVVHAADCGNLHRRVHREDLMDVAWADCPQGRFLADIRIEARNRRGVLARITTVLNEAEVNIEQIASEEKNSGTAMIDIALEARDKAFLETILARLRILEVVLNVERRKVSRQA